MSAPAGLPRITMGLDRLPRLNLDEHLDVHGGLPASIRPDDLIAEVAHGGLKGRGGADFPTATKLKTVARARGTAVVVANGSEGEPMSAKDRVLFETVPHLVLDGAVLAAAAVGARRIVISVPAGSTAAMASVRAAAAERRDTRHVEIVPVPARYLAGEESALVNVLNGGPVKPTLVPPRPFERGVDRRPTLVQNVETLAHLALIARHGGDWFRSIGTPETPGSALVTLAGAVHRPGVYEVAIGTAITAVLAAAGGATEEHRAMLVGGYFGTWLTPAAAGRATLDDASLVAYRASLGSGIVVVLPESACPAAEVARVLAWLAGETAGQCGPCVNGLASLADGLTRLVGGRADRDMTERLTRWCDQIDGRGACHHPNGAVRFLRSAFHVFGKELDDHRRHGMCDACAAPPVLATPAVATPRAA